MIHEESVDETNLMSLVDIPSEQDDVEELERPSKRTRTGGQNKGLAEQSEEDDKKKLAFKTTYEGFSIWGWVLCLLVERKGGPGKKAAGADAQALMAEWITYTATA